MDRTKIKWYLKEDYSTLMIRQEDKGKVPVSQSNHWRNCMSLLQVFILFSFLKIWRFYWRVNDDFNNIDYDVRWENWWANMTRSSSLYSRIRRFLVGRCYLAPLTHQFYTKPMILYIDLIVFFIISWVLPLRRLHSSGKCLDNWDWFFTRTFHVRS